MLVSKFRSETLRGVSTLLPLTEPKIQRFRDRHQWLNGDDLNLAAMRALCMRCRDVEQVQVQGVCVRACSCFGQRRACRGAAGAARARARARVHGGQAKGDKARDGAVQSKREKERCPRAAVAHPRPEKSGSATRTTRKQPVMR